MKKKKRKVNKGITLNRTNRLMLAKNWIGTYTGKNIVRGYAKHYRVDLLCAINDLELLDMVVAAEYKEAIKRSIAGRAMQKQKKKEMAEKQNEYFEDEHFSFIVGYTSGGAAYGTTWEEDTFFAVENKLPN